MTESRTPRPDLEKSAEPIEFVVEGDRVRGTLYLPAQARGLVGAVALAHGWSMVAGGDLEDYYAPPSSSRAWRR